MSEPIQPKTLIMSNTVPPATPNSSSKQPILFSSRSLRQFGFFAAGAGLFAVSMAITRRSILRRYQKDMPKFFHSNNCTNHNVNGAMEALEALNLATINVFSVGMMAAGGILWAFDISSVEEMRTRFQRNIMLTSTSSDPMMKDQLTDSQIEEWLASILARKEFRALRSENGVTNEQLQAKITKSQEESKRIDNKKY